MGSLKTPVVWVLPVLVCAVMLAALGALRRADRPPEEVRPTLEIDLLRAGAKSQETHVPRKPLILQLDLAGLPQFPAYTVELDDVLGVKVLQDGLGANNAKAAFKVPKLLPGRYFVRVTSPSGELLREFAIRVQ